MHDDRQNMLTMKTVFILTTDEIKSFSLFYLMALSHVIIYLEFSGLQKHFDALTLNINFKMENDENTCNNIRNANSQRKYEKRFSSDK